MNWREIYKALEFNYGWHRENAAGYRANYGIILCSPTRPIGITFGEIWIKDSLTGFWKRQGKLPPVKDFGIAMDQKSKLLTYITKEGTPVIAVDIS